MKILVITAEPNNFVPKKLKESGKSLGVEVEIVNIERCIHVEGLDGSSPESTQLCSTVHVVDEPEEGRKEVRKIEVDANTVVIPRLNEHHIELKIGLLKRLELFGCKFLNTPEGMALCNDKLMTQVKLNSAGIKTPLSFSLHGVEDVEAAIKFLEDEGKLKYPIIVKTLRGTHGIGVMKLDSRSSLVSVTQTLSKENLDFIIQEFCPHEQSARVIMIGDEVLAANLRGQPKEKDEFRTNSHLGSETEPYVPNEEEVAMGRRIVELFGTRFCAIDYLIVDNGGNRELVVLEVNGSPGLEAIQKNWPDKDLPRTVSKFAAEMVAPVNDVQPATSPVPVVAGSTGSAEEPAPATPSEPQAPESIPERVINEIEHCVIHRLIDDGVEARVDTGAKTSALHCARIEFDDEWTRFKRGDIVYKVPTCRVAKIKNVHAGTSTPRPVVKLDVTIKGERLNQVEFTLTDRSTMKYEVLIGRNVLERLGLPVMVYKNNGETAISGESEVYTEEE